MKSIFEERNVVFERKNHQMLTVDKDQVSLRDRNKDTEIIFANTLYIQAQDYDSSNQSYHLLAPQRKTAENPQPKQLELYTDPDAHNSTHNLFETKTILTAYAANQLGKAFPNNLDELEICLGRTLREKEIRLSNGEIIGAKKRVRLSEIRRAACVGTILSSISIYTKEKKSFFDTPDMVIPANVLSLYVLEAAITRNTGHGIDFSKSDPMTGMKNSEYMIIRYLDSGFFVNEDGGFDQEWHKVAHDRIAAYSYDLNEVLAYYEQ